MLKQIKRPGSDNTASSSGGQQFKSKPLNDTSDAVLAALDLAGVEVSAAVAIEARRLELAEIISAQQYLRLPSSCGCGGSDTFGEVWDNIIRAGGIESVDRHVSGYAAKAKDTNYDRGTRTKTAQFVEYLKAKKEMEGLK